MTVVLKMFRKFQRDVGTINSMARLGRGIHGGYIKGKQQMIVLGVVAGTFAITQLAKVAPKFAASMANVFKGKERSVGRGSSRPTREDGSLQDAVSTPNNRRVKYTPTSEVRPKKVSKLQELYEKGENYFKGKQEVQEFSAEDVRLVGQVIECCKEHNKTSNSLKVKYELIGKELNIELAGTTIMVTDAGISSMSGNTYYLYGKMDRDAALVRLMSEYSIEYLNLMVSILLAYEKDLFEVESYESLARETSLAKRERDEKIENERKLQEEIDYHFNFDFDEIEKNKAKGS